MAATEHVHGASLVIYLLVSVGLVIIGGVMSGLTLGMLFHPQFFLVGSLLWVCCLLKKPATFGAVSHNSLHEKKRANIAVKSFLELSRVPD